MIHLEPPISAANTNLGFTLYSTYTGHLLLKAKGEEFWSESFVLRRNEWHRLTLVLSPSGLVMVLVGGVSIIQVPENISELVSASISQQFDSGKATISSWPFGALFVGNYGLKPNQVESRSKDWLNELAHGAISGVTVQPHTLSEMSALFSLFAPPSPPREPSPTISHLKNTIPSNFVRIEQRSDLGTLESAIFGVPNASNGDGSLMFPPDSFPMPSRICRPLYSVDEMDEWEKYLSAFSTLELKAFKPAPIQPRRALEAGTPTVLLCHDFRGGYFKDSAWERSPPFTYVKSSSNIERPSTPLSSDAESSSVPSSASSSYSIPLADLWTESAKRSAVSSRNGFETFETQTFSPVAPAASETTPITMTEYIPQAYTFQHWSYIDIFCYFSHARVTIPPVATINAAHMNGVKVLGTLITEWEDGYIDTMRMIAGKDGDKAYYAKKLVSIAKTLNFEGWLVNIEHSMKAEEVPLLVAWMKEFKRLANLEKLIVVWYDSVIKNGELKWQSALTEDNLIWFDVCDLFFTDYHWKLGNLETTMMNAKEKAGKVLFGIDVWGRGTYGGGGWNTPSALKAIFNEKYQPKTTSSKLESLQPRLFSEEQPPTSMESLCSESSSKEKPKSSAIISSPASQDESHAAQSSPKLSVAIFGPGWTIESQADSYDSLYRNEMRFWQGVTRWNLFSESFEKHLKSYYRLYFKDHEPSAEFTVDDILSILEWSEDGAAGKAEEQARSYSQSVLNAVGGRFKDLPQLFEPRIGGSKWSWRHIRFDLLPTRKNLNPTHSSTVSGAIVSLPQEETSKITAEFLDSQPELTLSLWVKGNGPNPADPWRLRVLLLDAQNRLIQEFDTGILKGTAEWREMTFRWSQYGSGVRSILWLDGTRDAEGWAGFFGCTIDRPSILIDNPSTIDSVATYVKARELDNSRLPFVAVFETGQGSALYSNGEPMSYNMPSGGHWYNLAAQTAMPSLEIAYNSITPSFGSAPSLAPTSPSTSTSPTNDVPEILSHPSGSKLASSESPLKHVTARLVDASTIDGGVWHGSSCLRLDALVMAPSSSSDDRIGATVSSSGSISNDSIKKRVSSRKLLLSSTRLSLPRTEATINLFPLRIQKTGSKLSLKIIFRPVHIPTNSTVLVRITRRSGSSALAPLQWDLMDKEYRDPNGSSSVGWIHFLATWSLDANVVLDGIQLVISAVQGPSDHFQSSVSNSPATSRLNLNLRASSSQLIANTSHLLNKLSVLIGFLKIDVVPSVVLELPPSPIPSSTVQSALGLSYKLTWSSQSLFNSVPVYDVTAYWNPVPIPESLSHLGPPHYIITATVSTSSSDPLSPPSVTEVLCQGRTWNTSWVISGLPSVGQVVFSVSTIFPDYTTQAQLTERVRISWT